MRWTRWVKSGVPHRALVASYLEAAERGELDLSLALVDSTMVRAHQHTAGTRKKTAAITRHLAARVAV